MMQSFEHRIARVLPGSIAEELELEPGDVLLSVNGHEIEDIFDYQYFTNEEYLTVLVRRPDGEEWELEIEKEFEEDLGIEFENSLMDDYRSCRNKCVFCFIDQMPPGMRDTLYFKDDDSRLSFLQGNYVTLTNMSDHDIDRIIQYHLGPINISFHTTNPELRCRMLHNRFAGEVFPKIRRLADAGIELNGQIVLCRGINDGEELERSIRDMTAYLPSLRSVSVVPVGLSKYRDGLYPLEPFEPGDAGQVIDQIEAWQRRLYPEHGIHFVHASDEWYLLAGHPLPEEERYDGYPQLENGVGMLRLLHEEVCRALDEEGAFSAEKSSTEGKHLSGECGVAGDLRIQAAAGAPEGDEGEAPRTVSIATGRLAAPFIRKLGALVTERHPQLAVQVFEITNEFFGESITVSGLITAQDLIRQLKGKALGSRLLLPCNMLRSGEQVFLDDLTVADVETALQIEIRIVESGGYDFVRALTEA